MRTAPKSLTTLPALATLALLAVGIVLRIWYYWDARSLFIDEASPGFWLVFSQLLSNEARAATERKMGIAKEIADEKRRFEKPGAAGYWLKYR